MYYYSIYGIYFFYLFLSVVIISSKVSWKKYIYGIRSHLYTDSATQTDLFITISKDKLLRSFRLSKATTLILLQPIEQRLKCSADRSKGEKSLLLYNYWHHRMVFKCIYLLTIFYFRFKITTTTPINQLLCIATGSQLKLQNSAPCNLCSFILV